MALNEMNDRLWIRRVDFTTDGGIKSPAWSDLSHIFESLEGNSNSQACKKGKDHPHQSRIENNQLDSTFNTRIYLNLKIFLLGFWLQLAEDRIQPKDK